MREMEISSSHRASQGRHQKTHQQQPTKFKVARLRGRVVPARGRPVLLKLRSSEWFIISAVCTAIFTDIFLYAVIVPVFPFSLQSRVGIPEDEVQHWLSVLLAVYGAGLLVGSPICGVLADRIKYRRWPLLCGLLGVCGSTIMLCLATTLPLLIVGRLLQGLAASVIWIVGLALLSDTVGKKDIATALGYVGTALSLGTLVAPLLGGIVYDKAGYYAVFGMCFGVIALDVILRLTLIEKKAARKWLDEPTIQDEDEMAGELRDNPQTIDHPEKNESMDPELQEKRKKRRLPPIISLFLSRRMFAAFWGNLVIATMMCGLDTTLTIFVNTIFDYNSLQAGLIFLAVLVPIFFGPVIGLLVDRYGSRWIATAGMVFMVPAWILLRLIDHNSVRQKVLFCALLAMIGLGVAAALTGLMAEFSKICDDIERDDPDAFGKHGAYAQSYSIFNASWATGSIIGAFWSGGVYSTAGWGTMGWTFALLAGVSVVPILLFTDGWIGKSRKAT